MHIVKAINKVFENDEFTYTAKDDEKNKYQVYISHQQNDSYLRIIKNGIMIEIPYELEFKKGL